MPSLREAGMTRRTFTKLTIAGAATGAFPSASAGAAGAAAPVPAGEGPAKTPYKVLWNDDTTNIPKWTPGEVFTDDMLRGAINSVADKGIDAYMLSPGLGWIPWWQSKVYPDHYQWRQQTSGAKPDCFGRYMLAGGDLVAALVAHCRQVKLAPFVSYRLNDSHHQEQRQSLWVCRFYEEHPEYLLSSYRCRFHRLHCLPTGCVTAVGLGMALQAVSDRRKTL